MLKIKISTRRLTRKTIRAELGQSDKLWNKYTRAPELQIACSYATPNEDEITPPKVGSDFEEWRKDTGLCFSKMIFQPITELYKHALCCPGLLRRL